MTVRKIVMIEEPQQNFKQKEKKQVHVVQPENGQECWKPSGMNRLGAGRFMLSNDPLRIERREASWHPLWNSRAEEELPSFFQETSQQKRSILVFFLELCGERSFRHHFQKMLTEEVS